MLGTDTNVTCPICSRTVPRRYPWQRRCGSTQCKKRDQYHTARQRPAFVAANRARAASWYERNGERHRANVAARAGRVLETT